MTAVQEAYILIQRQPESNLKVIVDLLRRLAPAKPKTIAKRTGVASGKLNLPADFDEYFDELDSEIAGDFYGDNLWDIC